ncbi:MAG TPA: M24 family metallopeptidase [Stellaceae bacterium]|nr:M24 family metallopeptidase [Stellaceae bacterium]
MTEISERINTPISTTELERRWSRVRTAMEARRIDVLLMQNNNDFMGGYVKYFTDLPATNGYPVTVVFPRDDGMTVVGQGPFDMDRTLPPEGDGLRRGVKRVLTTPSYASAPYTAAYDAELAEKGLERFSGATIGLVGTATLPVAMLDHLRRGRLSNATFVDASDLVDTIKAVKSDEEIALMRRTAAMQDACMAAAFAAVAPGRKDIEIAAIAEQVGHSHGSEQGLFMAASGPVGTAAVMSNRHSQGRVIREGDQFTLLVESNGPGGFYTELGRTCVLGKASQEMKDEFAFVLEARRFTLERMKPGASCKQIWDEFNAFMRARQRPEERRLYCHGQGYDMVERPLVRFDETMPIGANMVFSCHPTYVTERTYSWACDNYLVGAHGITERLHQFPETITELG